jgi:DNA-binding NarL/FixJ family response regulator
MSGNEVWATEELAHADRLAHEVRWESNFDEARQVLVVLAVMHAPSDASRAQRYAALYSQIGTENVSPAFAVNGDRRAHAHALYAQGRIDQMLGRRDAAVTALQAAYEIFESASFHYRAAMAATALAEITADETWQAKALHHARSYPNCPLAAIVDESVSRAGAMPPNLTALQQQIARALFTGVEAQELSRRFSRSLYTIERQIALIHEAFGVTSRKALLEEAHRRNLI